MGMKKDILNRADIELLVNVFYNKVKDDEMLKHFFKKVNWEKHLTIMYDFWENAVFYSGVYSGNPMNVHQHLNERMPLTTADFKRWTDLFIAAVDEHFFGTRAELIKQRAGSIATVMQVKILKTN
jgi:hemoglobin